MANPEFELHMRIVTATAAHCLNAMLELFKPGMEATLLIRDPERPDGRHDFVGTSETDLRLAAEALQVRAEMSESGDPELLVRHEGPARDA